jgi:flagellar biosynthesis GTPase FlhF
MAVSAIVASTVATGASMYQGRKASKQAQRAQAENVTLQQQNLAQQEQATQQNLTQQERFTQQNLAQEASFARQNIEQTERLARENLAVQERAAQQQQAAFAAQEKAALEAQQRAEAQANLADQANNRANRKRPNVGAKLEANRAASSKGAGSTMLTGPGGVDTGSLALGRNTLLGQ